MNEPGMLTCRELVELMTDYLEGALEEASRARFEAHLGRCDGCSGYLEQMRYAIRRAGALREDAIDPEMRSRLLHAFRDWHAERAPH